MFPHGVSEFSLQSCPAHFRRSYCSGAWSYGAPYSTLCSSLPSPLLPRRGLSDVGSTPVCGYATEYSLACVGCVFPLGVLSRLLLVSCLAAYNPGRTRSGTLPMEYVDLPLGSVPVSAVSGRFIGSSVVALTFPVHTFLWSRQARVAADVHE